MTTPFADLFAQAESSTIEVDGEVLNAVVELSVVAPLIFTVVRTGSRSDRAQGLVLEAIGTNLRAAGTEARRVTLWSDTAPETVTLEIGEPGRFTVRAWNTWRDDDIAHAWVGWSAMKRRDENGMTILACRDGHEDGDFDDLIVELTYGPGDDSGVLTTAFQ